VAILFHRNTKTVKEIYDDYLKGNLTIDRSYQRRKVWMEQDKVRLIETMLMDLIIPEVFFWPAALDTETGETVTHIVDGQQRITSIVEFLSGDSPEFFRLTSKHLLNEKIMKLCGNLSFEELNVDFKRRLWSYNISIVNIDPAFTKQDITQMFYRLNLTNYSLNLQEKRNSKQSQFGEMAEALSTLDFWEISRVFSSADARRMKDIEYCCSIYVLAAEGIVDQTNGKKISDYYDDYADSFDDDRMLTQKIESAMDIIVKLRDKNTLSFIAKKAQMYTMFCFAFKLIDSKIDLTSEIFERFKLFITAYNLFRNEYDINFSNDNLRNIHEGLRKYKLASQEGLNKIGNRMIRFQTLYDYCVQYSSNIKESFSELAQLYQAQKNPGLKYEPFDPEDIIDVYEVGFDELN
jgi:hypothetical protein